MQILLVALTGPKTAMEYRKALAEQFSQKLNQSAFSAATTRMEALGYLTSLFDGPVRRLGATTKGVRAVVEQFQAQAAFVDKWRPVVAAVNEADFSPARRVPKKKPEAQRTPNQLEWTEILRLSPEHLRDLLEAGLQTGANPFALAASEIQGIDQKRGVLTLPASSISGSKIVDREIKIDPTLSRILRRAVADRKSGRIFLNSQGRPWLIGGLTQAFKSVRARAGLPREVKLSGRGGAAYKSKGDTKP